MNTFTPPHNPAGSAAGQDFVLIQPKCTPHTLCCLRILIPCPWSNRHIHLQHMTETEQGREQCNLTLLYTAES